MNGNKVRGKIDKERLKWEKGKRGSEREEEKTCKMEEGEG